jgi:hypothetical protein
MRNGFRLGYPSSKVCKIHAKRTLKLTSEGQRTTTAKASIACASNAEQNINCISNCLPINILKNISINCGSLCLFKSLNATSAVSDRPVMMRKYQMGETHWNEKCTLSFLSLTIDADVVICSTQTMLCDESNFLLLL